MIIPSPKITLVELREILGEYKPTEQVLEAIKAMSQGRRVAFLGLDRREGIPFVREVDKLLSVVKHKVNKTIPNLSRWVPDKDGLANNEVVFEVKNDDTTTS